MKPFNTQRGAGNGGFKSWKGVRGEQGGKGDSNRNSKPLYGISFRLISPISEYLSQAPHKGTHRVLAWADYWVSWGDSMVYFYQFEHSLPIPHIQFFSLHYIR